MRRSAPYGQITGKIRRCARSAIFFLKILRTFTAQWHSQEVTFKKNITFDKTTCVVAISTEPVNQVIILLSYTLYDFESSVTFMQASPFMIWNVKH